MEDYYQYILFDLPDEKPTKIQYWEHRISYSDDAETVVFITYMKSHPKGLFLMKRADAVKLCSSKKTSGKNIKGGWMLCFTTYIDEWLELKEKGKWQKDDGRFNDLLDELQINIIYRQE